MREYTISPASRGGVCESRTIGVDTNIRVCEASGARGRRLRGIDRSISRHIRMVRRWMASHNSPRNRRRYPSSPHNPLTTSDLTFASRNHPTCSPAPSSVKFYRLFSARRAAARSACATRTERTRTASSTPRRRAGTLRSTRLSTARARGYGAESRAAATPPTVPAAARRRRTSRCKRTSRSHPTDATSHCSSTSRTRSGYAPRCGLGRFSSRFFRVNSIRAEGGGCHAPRALSCAATPHTRAGRRPEGIASAWCAIDVIQPLPHPTHRRTVNTHMYMS